MAHTNTDANMASKKNQTHYASEKPSYNVSVVETQSTNLSKQELVYTPTDMTQDTPVKRDHVHANKAIMPVLKFMLKYVYTHLTHPILMTIADITILFLFAPLFIGYTNSVTLVGNILQGLSTNPLIIAIAAIIVIVFLSQFIFSSGDVRTTAEKKEDERINRIMNRFNRY